MAAPDLPPRETLPHSPVPVRHPPLELCTDNAAMVAAAAYFHYQAGEQAGWDLDVVPGLRLSAASLESGSRGQP